MHASLSRKASSKPLDFNRIDYPHIDPPEWDKFVTTKLENGEVRVGGTAFQLLAPTAQCPHLRGKL